jgi:hypothetical protein
MMALSIALTVLDRTHSATRGVPVELGPLKLSWVAAGLMVVAISIAVKVIVRLDQD